MANPPECFVGAGGSNPGYDPEMTSPSWSGEKLYFRGDDYFRDLLKAIHQARSTIDFETYIFEKGRLGDLVVSALARAAKRGVQVRLLVDGIGSPDFAFQYGASLEKSGARFRSYRYLTDFFAARGWKGFLALFRTLRRLWGWGQHRDHRKLCILDGREVWLGSFNVSDLHLEGVRGPQAWRDTGMRLQGVRAPVFALAFQLAWEERASAPWSFSRGKSLLRQVEQGVLEGPVRLNVTLRLRRLFNRRLASRLIGAKKKIWLTTPYFLPTRPLFRALLKSVRQGCDVRLLLPGPSDVPMVRWASMVFYPRLLRAGCRIFEYQGRVLHAKSLLVDGLSYVGSSNLNHRSLLHDLEIIVLPQKKASLRALERQFEADLRHSREASLDELAGRPFWSKMLSALFFQFRYWF